MFRIRDCFGMTFTVQDEPRQLKLNADCIFGEYYNGMCDMPDEYKEMSEDEALKYAKSQIYDMFDDGKGTTVYGDGIAKHLKFLGDDVIDKVILDSARECGVLAA